MPRLAFDIAFCAQLSKLQGSVRQGDFDAWEKFERSPWTSGSRGQA
ncbi:hypothetical protein JO379_005132 [Streptomyces syringium]|uniref:Uncharacterized protein n=1 Tax=Streptomyces syringium TaxID=76729 RepID=A0ABS4YA48_9ACTN|nr:hypothetical protein [Streptomyces syringium]